jgi:hypothetical protein
MPDVSKALSLTPEQVTRLNALTDQTTARYRQNYAALAAQRDADRAARALNRQYYGDWAKGSREVLDEAQRARYQQLEYQYHGFNALYDPGVQSRLALTPAQAKALHDQAAWSDRQLRDIGRMADPAQAARAYRDYWSQRQERLNTYLTPQQQKVWAEMTGPPYTFQPAVPQR